MTIVRLRNSDGCFMDAITSMLQTSTNLRQVLNQYWIRLFIFQEKLEKSMEYGKHAPKHVFFSKLNLKKQKIISLVIVKISISKVLEKSETKEMVH